MPIDSEVLGYGQVSREKPQAMPDNNQLKQRIFSRGELGVMSIFPDKKTLAEEGSVYVATNPTPGTGVARAANAAGNNTFVNTTALLVVGNMAPLNSPAPSPRVYLDKLRLMATSTAVLTATSMQFVVETDNINRAPTAGASTRSPFAPWNVNMDAMNANAQFTRIWEWSAADLTVPASGSAARRCRFSIPCGVMVTLDQYVVNFGAEAEYSVKNGGAAARATDPASAVCCAPPVIIGPQQYAVIYMWVPSGASNAFTAEYELTVIER